MNAVASWTLADCHNMSNLLKNETVQYTENIYNIDN